MIILEEEMQQLAEAAADILAAKTADGGRGRKVPGLLRHWSMDRQKQGVVTGQDVD
jgi:hypothetical protein